jgi:CTD small phosphatase-like protein 2
VILEIDFPGEETVCAGINLRPYLMQCLQEASKNFQVIVFTASHQTYADAILNYIDPDKEYISHRLYRQHCVLTPEGYYVKDLRIIRNRSLTDMVIVDNSVYSFAYQIDNGIPIVSFYNDTEDEELLHLIFYLECLSTCQDVRDQNREAFELSKMTQAI